MTFASMRKNLGVVVCKTFQRRQSKLCNMAKVGRCGKKEEISAGEFAYQWPLKSWPSQAFLTIELVLSIKFD